MHLGRNPRIAENRRDIDDAARLLQRRQALGEFERQHPGALEVRVEHRVPVRLGVLENRLARHDAGIVDQDIDRPQSGLGRGESSADTGGVGHVHGDGSGLAAGARDFALHGVELVHAAPGQRDLRAAGRQRHGKAAAQAARRTRDQRNFAFEIECQRHGILDDFTIARPMLAAGQCGVRRELRLAAMRVLR